MRVDTRSRKYQVGLGDVKLDITDCGSVALMPDEQVTFTTEIGGQLDVTRKSWGFTTPSLNHRLPLFGLRAVLVNGHGRYFIFFVEVGREQKFERYIKDHGHKVIVWLNGDNLDQLGFPRSSNQP